MAPLVRCAALAGLSLAACQHGALAPTVDAPAGGDSAVDAPATDASPDAGRGSSAGCPSGSTLVVARTACAAQPVAPPSALATSAAAPGDVVGLAGFDEASAPCLPTLVCAPADAHTMLFSDDPETLSRDGVLYADTVGPGPTRVYVYHVNAAAALRKFPVVVLNQGASDAHVTITKAGVGAPSTDYVGEGKAVAAAWLGSQLARVVTVPAGQRVLLDGALDAAVAAKDELVHAIYDVDADAPVKISVVSVPASADAAAVTAGLSLLPADGQHDRGTFPGADLWLVASAGGEGPSARRVRLGDGTTEPILAGRDATTGAAAHLGGNYGVTYRFVISAPGALRLAASERGGAWAGASGATPLPSASGPLDTTTAAVWLGTFAAGVGADLTLLTGGGSSLPLDVFTLTP